MAVNINSHEYSQGRNWTFNGLSTSTKPIHIQTEDPYTYASNYLGITIRRTDTTEAIRANKKLRNACVLNVELLSKDRKFKWDVNE